MLRREAAVTDSMFFRTPRGLKWLWMWSNCCWSTWDLSSRRQNIKLDGVVCWKMPHWYQESKVRRTLGIERIARCWRLTSHQPEKHQGCKDKAGSPQLNKAAQHHHCFSVSGILNMANTSLQSNGGRRLQNMEQREPSILDVQCANRQQPCDAVMELKPSGFVSNGTILEPEADRRVKGSKAWCKCWEKVVKSSRQMNQKNRNSNRSVSVLQCNVWHVKWLMSRTQQTSMSEWMKGSPRCARKRELKPANTFVQKDLYP